jgi:hypothetical protein
VSCSTTTSKVERLFAFTETYGASKIPHHDERKNNKNKAMTGFFVRYFSSG